MGRRADISQLCRRSSPGERGNPCAITPYSHPSVLTNRYEPHKGNLCHGLGTGLVLAVLNGFLDGYVAVQGDGAEVHDGGSGEEHI